MKTYLITGANRGIGLEMAKQLHAKGNKVFAVCRKSSPALNGVGVEVIESIDVSVEADVKKLAERFNGQVLDVLINNAGILKSDELNTFKSEDVLRQFQVNALGALNVTRALLPCLKNGSKIAMITSRMGSLSDNTSGGYYGYRASKAALNIIAVSLARDLKDRGIAVTILHPGFVRTDMTEQQGHIDVTEAAEGLLKRIAELNLKSSGGFWHSSGEALPW